MLADIPEISYGSNSEENFPEVIPSSLSVDVSRYSEMLWLNDRQLVKVLKLQNDRQSDIFPKF